MERMKQRSWFQYFYSMTARKSTNVRRAARTEETWRPLPPASPPVRALPQPRQTRVLPGAAASTPQHTQEAWGHTKHVPHQRGMTLQTNSQKQCGKSSSMWRITCFKKRWVKEDITRENRIFSTKWKWKHSTSSIAPPVAPGGKWQLWTPGSGVSEQ